MANPFAAAAARPAAANPFAAAAGAKPNPFAAAGAAANPFAKALAPGTAGAAAAAVTLDPQDQLIIAAVQVLNTRIAGHVEEADVVSQIRRLLDPYLKITLQSYAFRVRSPHARVSRPAPRATHVLVGGAGASTRTGDRVQRAGPDGGCVAADDGGGVGEGAERAPVG